MDRCTVERMAEIVAIAGIRMHAAAHHPNIQYAEILFMTPEEACEFLQLRLMLPSAGQECEAARMRIQAKIAARKLTGPSAPNLSTR
jgi:hypothetical protein